MIETLKIIHALHYLLKKIGKADKLKLLKLLFLADKYHLIKYGRTVTGDEYWAMEYGPVGSVAKDILSFDPNFNSYELKMAKRFIQKEGENDFKPSENIKIEDLDYLSETDKEALDFIVDHFGGKPTFDLVNFTHKYPEWKKYEEDFKEGFTKREKIKLVDMISTIEEDPFDFSEEHIQETKDMILGFFD